MRNCGPRLSHRWQNACDKDALLRCPLFNVAPIGLNRQPSTLPYSLLSSASVVCVGCTSLICAVRREGPVDIGDVSALDVSVCVVVAPISNVHLTSHPATTADRGRAPASHPRRASANQPLRARRRESSSTRTSRECRWPGGGRRLDARAAAAAPCSPGGIPARLIGQRSVCTRGIRRGWRRQREAHARRALVD